MTTLVLGIADGVKAAAPLIALIALALVLIPGSRQRALATTSLGILVTWYAVVYAFAEAGAFRVAGPDGIPTLAVAFIPVAVGLPVLLLSGPVRRMLTEPGVPAGLIAVQTYRLVGGSFLLLFAVHRLPAIFGILAGGGDLLVGASAWAVANSVRKGRLARGVIWNLLGLLDLVVAVSLGVAFSPPFHLSPDGITTAALTVLPNVLVPAFLVPVSILLHVASLRTLRSMAATASDRGGPRREAFAIGSR